MLELLLRRTTSCILPFRFRILSKQVPGIILRRNLTGVTEQQAELVKDVVLYKHENPRFHLYVSVFAFFQFTFWSLLGLNMLEMRDVPVNPSEDMPYWRRVNWGDNFTKKVMASACFLMGNLTITLSWFFTIRSIRYLILRKNREMVSIITFTPTGRNRYLEVPLAHISPQGSRGDTGFLPIKIKGRFFMFVMDLRKGYSTFPNPRLFDQTVGMRRKL